MLKLRRSRQRRFWRRAGFWALLLVVILLVMGISDRGSRQLNFLQRPVFAAMTTVGGVVGHLRNKLRNLFAGGYSREISRLNRSLEQLKIAAAANLEQQQELSSLRKLFSLVSPLHYQLKGARVIRLELRGAHHLMVINRGSRDQVSRGRRGGRR